MKKILVLLAYKIKIILFIFISLSTLGSDSCSHYTAKSYLKLSLGYEHSCGIAGDGTSWCWGRSDRGQLGEGFTDRFEAYQSIFLDLEDEQNQELFYKDIASGFKHSCALTGKGEVYCWGDNRRGQLGRDPNVDEASEEIGYPVKVQFPDGVDQVSFKEISAGQNHTCALDALGEVWCWGDNRMGQLGRDYDQEMSFIPSRINVGNNLQDLLFFQTLSSGGNLNCGLDGKGSIWCWGDTFYIQSQRQNRNPITQVENHYFPENAQNLSFKDLDVGGVPNNAGFCALSSKGEVWCWGGIYGPLARVIGDDEFRQNNTFKDLSVSHFHACALTDSANVWCWGGNDLGQLGNGEHLVNGNNQLIFNPVMVQPDERRGYDFVSISTGGKHSCAITSLGIVKCWGDDTFGQLGSNVANNNDNFSSLPIKVKHSTLSNFSSENIPLFESIVTGAKHACALDAQGYAWCWGSNFAGQLGIGRRGLDNGDSIPIRIEEHRFISLALTSYSSCGLKANGEIWCWGGEGFEDDNYGSLEPILMGSEDFREENQFKEMSSANTAFCALTTKGDVYCWDQLDQGFYSFPFRRDLTESEKIIKVFTNTLSHGDYYNNYLSALTIDGRIINWFFYQRRIETHIIQDDGNHVKGFIDHAFGSSKSCGLRADGTVQCWFQWIPRNRGIQRDYTPVQIRLEAADDQEPSNFDFIDITTQSASKFCGINSNRELLCHCNFCRLGEVQVINPFINSEDQNYIDYKSQKSISFALSNKGELFFWSLIDPLSSTQSFLGWPLFQIFENQSGILFSDFSLYNTPSTYDGFNVIYNHDSEGVDGTYATIQSREDFRITSIVLESAYDDSGRRRYPFEFPSINRLESYWTDENNNILDVDLIAPSYIFSITPDHLLTFESIYSNLNINGGENYHLNFRFFESFQIHVPVYFRIAEIHGRHLAGDQIYIYSTIPPEAGHGRVIALDE